MTKHDEARRAFLLGAAVGAGAVAGVTLVPDALAQTHEPSTTGTGPAHSHAGGPGLGAFFNSEDAATVAVFTERLMPGAPGMPGARDTDVLNYIDLALAGAYADLQYFIPARARLARCLLPQNLQRTLPASLRRATG